MNLYGANNRHPKDDRILVIEDLADFALWRERKQHKIHGIMCKSPFPQAAVKKAAAHIIGLSRLRVNPPLQNPKTVGNPYTKQVMFTSDAWDALYLDQQLDNAGFAGAAKNIVTTLSNVFGMATDGARNNRFWTDFIRVNDISVGQHHRHSPSLSFSFTKRGVILNNGIEEDDGEDYEVKPGTPVLFDQTIWHKSPDFKKSWKKEPRVSAVILSGQMEPL